VSQHGLIAGATGTGKTYTLAGLVENYSRQGVPCFVVDAKGDLSGLARALPYRLIDAYGNKGQHFKTSILGMGAPLVSRALSLSPVQCTVLEVVFAFAEDNGLPLNTLQDLRQAIKAAALQLDTIAAKYGAVQLASLDIISRQITPFERAGGADIFGPQSCFTKWLFSDSDLATVASGQLPTATAGQVTFLDGATLTQSPQLYSAFIIHALKWLLDNLPEAGDCEKPVLMLFIDEAHLLFKDLPPAMLAEVERVIRLIRSKGVGVFFATQNPSDIPPGVLAQLGNRLQHALHDAKAAKAAAEGLEGIKATDILSLARGQAVCRLNSQPPATVMMQGPSVPLEPLTDGERLPWLDKVTNVVQLPTVKRGWFK
jgi:hypothetical protein